MQNDHSCYTLKTKEEGEIGIGMCVCSTGLMMNPLVENLAGKIKRFPKSGAIVTNDRLQALRENGSVIADVFGMGDCAQMESAAYPATAQVASQKASWLAKRLNKGDIEHQKFTYKNLGVMAYIGNWNAILQSDGGDISGRIAWFIWRGEWFRMPSHKSHADRIFLDNLGAYLVKSVSWRNRILIPMFW